MMMPLRISWYSDWTFRRPRMLSSTLRISAPMTVPRTAPLPPERLVPPMTTAAMALSS
jgi:hypothetical protein